MFIDFTANVFVGSGGLKSLETLLIAEASWRDAQPAGGSCPGSRLGT